MAHTITVHYAGKNYILPTTYQGRQVDYDRALELFMEGLLKPLSMHETYKAACEAPPAAAKRY